MTDSALRAALRREMAAQNTPWSPLAVALDGRGPGAAPAALAVLPLTRPTALLARPDAETRLQAQGILSPAEVGRLRGLKLPKRRHEWLGGRLAAKGALARLRGWDDDRPLADLSIANDDQGRPFVDAPASPADAPPLHLSISHSGRFAAALAARTPCGLDVQSLSPRLADVRTYFLTDAEAALAPDLEELVWFALVWTAKEAIKKCRYAHSPTFMERVRVRGLEGDPRVGPATLRCRLREGGELAVRAMSAEGHALALCLDDGAM